MNRVTIVDYGMGNLDSVRRAVEVAGGSPTITGDRTQIFRADRVILPGVGSFRQGAENLRSLGLHEALVDHVIGAGLPLLGICLGMQLLAQTGDEGGSAAGLGWFDADVRILIPTGDDRRLPHVGWNEVNIIRPSPLFEGIDSGSDFYFVHSFHVLLRSDDYVVATTPYCGTFVSALWRGTVHALQFHPEKSQENGLRVLRNFMAL